MSTVSDEESTSMMNSVNAELTKPEVIQALGLNPQDGFENALAVVQGYTGRFFRDHLDHDRLDILVSVVPVMLKTYMVERIKRAGLQQQAENIRQNFYMLSWHEPVKRYIVQNWYQLLTGWLRTDRSDLVVDVLGRMVLRQNYLTNLHSYYRREVDMLRFQMDRSQRFYEFNMTVANKGQEKLIAQLKEAEQKLALQQRQAAEALQKFEKQIKKLEKEISKLQNDNYTCKDAKTVLESDNQMLRQRMQYLEAANSSLEKETSDTNAKYKKLLSAAPPSVVKVGTGVNPLPVALGSGLAGLSAGLLVSKVSSSSGKTGNTAKAKDTAKQNRPGTRSKLKQCNRPTRTAKRK